jgi:hypothetical protein
MEMKNKRSVLKLIGIISGGLVLLFLLSIGITLLSVLIRVDSPPSGYMWNEEAEFRTDLGTTVEMNGADYKVMIFTDQHYTRVFGDKKTDKLFDSLVTTHSPDLILLLGDQCFTPFNRASYRHLIKKLDEKKIPWAPIFGNHDASGKATKNRLAEMLSDSSYCLFRYGPNNIDSIGNYFINLTNNDDFVHTLYFLDSGRKRKGNYPPPSEFQVAWYEWAVNGMNAVSGRITPSSLFIHIPLPEFKTGYDEAVANNSVIYGSRGESECPSNINSGLFQKIKTLGSTKSIFSGHDHTNDYSVLYDGIFLTYSVSSGYGSYGSKHKKGCTILTIKPNGATEQRPIYYP